MHGSKIINTKAYCYMLWWLCGATYTKRPGYQLQSMIIQHARATPHSACWNTWNIAADSQKPFTLYFWPFPLWESLFGTWKQHMG
jgi:hypothetical protein